MPKPKPVQRNPLARLPVLGPPDTSPAGLPPVPDPPQPPRPQRVEYLPPSRLEPDPYQPRHPLLPPGIRVRFFAGEIDAYQAAGEWLAQAAAAPASGASLGREVQALLDMGATFDTGGQVNPITGYPLGSGETDKIRIETGERRFWAAVLKAAAAERPAGTGLVEPLLRVTLVPGPSRERQLLENLHLETPTAVGQARGLAGLILERTGVHPPAVPGEDTLAYFRQALDVPLSEALLAYLIPIVKVKQRRIYQLLEILRLPSEALDLADQARLPYLALAGIISGYPPEDWPAQVALSARKALESPPDPDDPEGAPTGQPVETGQVTVKTHIDPGLLAARGIRRFYHAAYRSWRTRGNALDTVANEIYAQGHAADTLTMLRELASLLDARIKGSEP